MTGTWFQCCTAWNVHIYNITTHSTHSSELKCFEDFFILFIDDFVSLDFSDLNINWTNTGHNKLIYVLRVTQTRTLIQASHDHHRNYHDLHVHFSTISPLFSINPFFSQIFMTFSLTSILILFFLYEICCQTFNIHSLYTFLQKYKW